MAEIVLSKPDLALFADIAGTRIELATLITGNTDEQWDSATVWFDGGESGQLPVEYRGQGCTAGITCQARYGEHQHDDLVALEQLLRTARGAADGRLQLRTNAGTVAGMDGPYVGHVASWSRPRVMGRVWDVSFRFDFAASTADAD